MKEISFRQVYDAPAKMMWQRVFLQDSFVLECHASMGHSDVVLRSWDASNERSVDYDVCISKNTRIAQMLLHGRSDDGFVRTRISQKQKQLTNGDKFILQVNQRFVDPSFSEIALMQIRFAIHAQGQQGYLTINIRCEYSGTDYTAKNEIESNLLHLTETESRHICSSAMKKCIAPSASIFTVQPGMRDSPFQQDETLTVSFRGADQQAEVASLFTPKDQRYKEDNTALSLTPNDPSSSHNSSTDSVSASKQTNIISRSHSPISIVYNESPSTSVCSNTNSPLLSSSMGSTGPVLPTPDQTVISQLRQALDESIKDKNEMRHRVRELEQKVAHPKNDHRTVSTRLQQSDLQEILDQLKSSLVELADVQEIRKRLELQLQDAEHRNKLLKTELASIVQESSDRTSKINELITHIGDLEVENEGYRRTLNAIVLAEPPSTAAVFTQPRTTPQRRPRSMNLSFMFDFDSFN